MAFKDKTTTKKGELGEAIIDEHIKSKGFVPYKPDADQAHPFDRLCASRDKKRLYIAEVKSKARRMMYPDTGIDVKHFNDYQNIQGKYGIGIFMFFVDEELGMVYGNPLKEISLPCNVFNWKKNRWYEYPMTYDGIIYFPTYLMKKISNLNENVISELKELTTKNNIYVP